MKGQATDWCKTVVNHFDKGTVPKIHKEHLNAIIRKQATQ